MRMKTDNPQWILYSLYVVVSLISWSWHGEIEKDDLTRCSAMMVQLWTLKRDGGWRWEWYGGYKQIWEIRGTTCLIGFRRHCISVLTHWIGSHTCHIQNGKLPRTQYSLKRQFLMMISPISTHCSLSHPQSTLTSPKNTKLSHPSLSFYTIIIS